VFFRVRLPKGKVFEEKIWVSCLHLLDRSKEGEEGGGRKGWRIGTATVACLQRPDHVLTSPDSAKRRPGHERTLICSSSLHSSHVFSFPDRITHLAPSSSPNPAVSSQPSPPPPSPFPLVGRSLPSVSSPPTPPLTLASSPPFAMLSRCRKSKMGRERERREKRSR
jgi:hypothetical protein